MATPNPATSSTVTRGPTKRLIRWPSPVVAPGFARRTTMSLAVPRSGGAENCSGGVGLLPRRPRGASAGPYALLLATSLVQQHSGKRAPWERHSPAPFPSPPLSPAGKEGHTVDFLPTPTRDRDAAEASF